MRLEIIFIWNLINVLEPSLGSMTTDSELWRLHLQLYTTYCGEAVFCDNDTGHMTPAGYPCCMSCSCLPTCRRRHNCCPKIGYETEKLMDATEANESNRTSIGDSDGSTTKGTLQTKTKPVNLTARIIQSLEDQPDQEGPKHSYPTLKDDDALSERETGVEPICFRPQVINRPNGYLDSDAYLMIAACREKFKDDEIKDKCEDAMDNTDIYDMSPVTSRLTGLSYVNKFCLMCNEPIVLDPVVWEAKFVDVGNYYQMYLVFNPNEFIEMLAMYGGNIHFIPVASHPVQQCESYAISTCNQTGLSDGFDEIMEEICHQGHSLPILHNSMRFKNIACLLCNEGGSFNGILSCGLWINLEKPYNTYTLTLNIRDTAPDGKTEKGLIHGSYLNHAVLKLPKTKRCPPGYTALLGYCRRFICPRGQYISKGKCIPLYQRITGLDFGVQIDVFPSKPVPKKFSSYFLDELTKVYNVSLSRYVTLQIRHISVWFGPHGTKAQNKYYMFNLYLYNTSDTIDYSLAVNEIKDFFYDLKSHENLSLLDGTEIGLNIKFNHRLDIRRYKPSLKVPSSFVQWDISVTAGGRLSPVVGTFFNREQRFMRITNLNWCPRVAFASFKDLNEVEWLKENCHIKQANITAYQTQFDDRSTNPPVGHIGPHYDTVYYFCLDLFVDHMNTNHPDKSSGNTNYVKSPILLNDKNNNGSDMTSPESIIIVSVFGSLILIIAFYRVKRQTGQTDENRYVGNGE